MSTKKTLWYTNRKVKYLIFKYKKDGEERWKKLLILLVVIILFGCSDKDSVKKNRI